MALHKDLIKDILKIEVSENNPLTAAKIYQKVVEHTRTEAEMSQQNPNSHEAYVTRKYMKQNSRCHCCNKTTQHNQKLCETCFRSGPPRAVYCPNCRIAENHVKEACRGRVVTWPNSVLWQKAKSLGHK